MQQALQELRQAEANSAFLYKLLEEAIKDGTYALNAPYNGLKIICVWDEKPIIWRPAAFYQYDFTSISCEVPRPKVEVDDVLHDYHHAKGVESAARTKYHAKYTQAILDWLSDPGSRDDVVRTPIQVQSVVLRIYEVKLVK